MLKEKSTILHMLSCEGESDLCKRHDLPSRTTMCATGAELDIACTPAGRLRVSSCPIPRVITEHATFFSTPKVSDGQPGFVRLNDFHRFRTSHVPDCDDALLRSNSKFHTVV